MYRTMWQPPAPKVYTYFVGLDLGQTSDYSAVAVLERTAVNPPVKYHGRHLDRVPLGTSYPKVVEYVRDLMLSPELRGQARLVVDATGVGRPVVDLLRDARLDPMAVTITAGDTAAYEDGVWRVPKRELVTKLQVLMQSKELHFAEELHHVPTLVKEMLSFEYKITKHAHDTYGAWREGTHDDLVLAVAVAVWAAERPAAPRLPPSISQRSW